MSAASNSQNIPEHLASPTPSPTPSSTPLPTANTTPSTSTNNNNQPTPSLSVNTNSPHSTSAASPSPTTSNSTTIGPLQGTLGNGIRITERSMKDINWPTNLILDLGKANWLEWSRTLSLSVHQCGLRPWLDGSIPCPDPNVSADAHYVWSQNDDALSAFILRCVSPADIDNTNACTTAFQIYKCLRILHKNQGAYAQISLLMKALELRLSYDRPLRDTVAEARNFYRRIIAMGKIKDNDIFTAILLHAMSGDFLHLQQSVQNMTHLPSFNSEMIIKRILEEDALICRRQELGQPANPLSHVTISSQSAFLANPRPRGVKPFCSNCKRENHTFEFCISTGGKMAGKTADEARAAYRAKNPRPPRPSTFPSVHVVSSSSNPSSTIPVPSTPSITASSPSPHLPVIINGTQYIPDPAWTSASSSQPNPSPRPTSAYITEVPDLPDYPYHAFLAFSNFAPLLGNSSYSSALSANSVPFTSSPTCYSTSIDPPFVIDSGAACHLSPVMSDFKSLRPISPHPINGISHSIHAVGIGTIEITTSTGKLILHDAFYVPDASVRLISVFLLLRPSSTVHYHALFEPNYVLLLDNTNKIIAKGVANGSRKLFFLTDFLLHVSPFISPPSSAHYTSRLPDLDSWHKHLGHCSVDTIIRMARSLGAKGMPIDLSRAASKCEACILGKQTRSSVPKIREGPRATKPLECVYIDLCGPMSKPSRTGRLYSMNFIDDFSSFVWSLPLRSKSEASIIFKHWLTAVEHQSPHKLKCLVTDNGELTSLQLRDLCTDRGILHLFTAPYTSAHNGRAERLHRTIMNRARSMRIACSAPLDMWDEFCATAAYLNNLTFTSANHEHQGKSPYQLWHSRDPPLLHLHEIGCRAYSLVMTHNPKLFECSVPCILIGYAPNSKAYRLWDPTTNRIFNSFHVSFIESHQLPLLPPPPYPPHTSNPLLKNPSSPPSDSPSSSSSSTINTTKIPPKFPIPPSTLIHPTLTSHFPQQPHAFIPISLPTHPLSPKSPPSSSPDLPLQYRLSNPPPAFKHFPQPQQPPQIHPIPAPNDTNVQQNTVTHQNFLHSTVPHQSNTVPNHNITHDTSITVLPNNILPLPVNTNPSPHQINTVPHQINTVPNPNNTVSHQNTVSLQNTVTHQNDTTTTPQDRNIVPPQDATPPIISPPTPIQPANPPAPHPPLRRSARLAKLPPQNFAALTSPMSPPPSDYTSAFLSEFAPLRDSHFLLPLTLDSSFTSSSSVNDALSAFATGSTELVLDQDDDPLWATAICSPEREYWNAGACEELKSLTDLKVFLFGTSHFTS